MKITEAKIQLLNAEGFAGVQIDCGEEDGSQVDLLDEVETHLDDYEQVAEIATRGEEIGNGPDAREIFKRIPGFPELTPDQAFRAMAEIVYDFVLNLPH